MNGYLAESVLVFDEVHTHVRTGLHFVGAEFQKEHIRRVTPDVGRAFFGFVHEETLPEGSGVAVGRFSGAASGRAPDRDGVLDVSFDGSGGPHDPGVDLLHCLVYYEIRVPFGKPESGSHLWVCLSISSWETIGQDDPKQVLAGTPFFVGPGDLEGLAVVG